jgi:TldD protein
MSTRREFVRAGSIAAAGLLGYPLHTVLARTVARRGADAPRAGDPALRELAARAIDAARSAGATYADVRFTRSQHEVLTCDGSGAAMPVAIDDFAVGVRALVDGYWGFVASPVWTSDEAERLGREAAAQARVNTWGKTRTVRLDLTPAGASGEWVMPVKRDPFTVPIEEKIDYVTAVMQAAGEFPLTNMAVQIVFARQEKTFASSDGAVLTQTLYNSLAESWIDVVVGTDVSFTHFGMVSPSFVTATGVGYEILEDVDLIALLPSLHEKALFAARGQTPVDVGRYDVVLSAPVTAQLVDQTIGATTELDRALGLEWNATGGSYLAPPHDILGRYRLGTPALTVTANRSEPGGVATVRWDDDGVTPDQFTLVQDGIVQDYQTTREQVAWLDEWYRSTRRPSRSHGCANSASAAFCPLQARPNLVMAPGRAEATFEDLVADTPRGLAIEAGDLIMESRYLSGVIAGDVRGRVYEITNGKI